MFERHMENSIKEEDYLKLKTDLAGETVVRGRLFETSDFGYETDVKRIAMEQVITPVHVNGTEVVIRLLQKPHFYYKDGEVPKEQQERADSIGVTWIHIGGAASQDDPHIGDLVVRLERSTRDTNLRLNNVILLPHPLGAPRTKGEFDTTDFSDSAEALSQALRRPEVKISGKVVVTGISAGAAVAAALAATNPDIDVLVLMDPAGMGDHPSLARKFAVNDPLMEYSHLRQKGSTRLLAFRETWQGLAKSMSTGKGVPSNIFEMVQAFFPDETHRNITKAYGVDGDAATDGLRINLLSKDSSSSAREKLGGKLEVIVSPAMAGNVVNFLRVHNKCTETHIEVASKEPHSDVAQRLIEESKSTLRMMFPNVAEGHLHLLPWWKSTHMSVASEQEYMDNIVQKAMNLLTEK